MAINFPPTPVVGEQFTVGAMIWQWDGQKWIFVPAAAPELPSANLNMITNGAMSVDQRNNGATSTTNTATSFYTLDMWAHYTNNAYTGWTIQRVLTNDGLYATPLPDGEFRYCLKYLRTSALTIAAANFYILHQMIEADMASALMWGTPQARPATLSFWVYCNLSGGSLYQMTGVVRNNLATPNVNLRQFPFTFTMPVNSAWQKVVINIPAMTTGTWNMSGNAGAVQVAFCLGAGAGLLTAAGNANTWLTTNAAIYGVAGSDFVVTTNNRHFSITGVKLELGGEATPYIQSPPSVNLANCQRYYQTLTGLKITGAGPSLANIRNSTSLVAPLRATPTILYSGQTYTTNVNANSIANDGLNPASFTTLCTDDRHAGHRGERAPCILQRRP